jgi:hypothetical protein
MALQVRTQVDNSSRNGSILSPAAVVPCRAPNSHTNHVMAAAPAPSHSPFPPSTYLNDTLPPSPSLVPHAPGVTN